MAAWRLVIILLAGTLLLSACGAAEGTLRATTPTLPPTPLPLATGPSPDPFFASDGGGEPRTSGYWLVWNGCTPDNRAEVAAANGGRQAGWIILDDLLLDPGILLGQLQVESCQQGANLLERLDTSGGEHKGDPAYQLAQGLLAAQLNLAAGGEFCPAAGEAVQAGQLLLLSLEFNGQGDYLQALQEGQLGETATFLIEQFGAYNRGGLCR